MSTASAAPQLPNVVEKYKLLHVNYNGGMELPASATVTIEIDGRHVTKQAAGVGPVNAVYKAITELVPHDNAEFLLSHVENAKQSKGSEGVAHVCADFKVGGTEIIGEGSDVDTVVATAKAMVNALNQIACFDQGTSH